uniref:Lipase domain-containing protein n=1 Tax=Trichuris muris TaxID=70415 RepID=A0A5S6QEP7_TRIMR
MKEELLKKNITVIIVDWTKGSHAPNYYQAASNTRVVGAVVAELINNLLNNTYFDMKDITIVGFSLGAHVCGFAGKKLGKLNHIIALDPAGPLFSGHVPEVRLAPTDADFVECIHTDGKAFIHGGLGTMEPMGHVDFYPNGGMTQLGCPKNAKEIILDLWYLNSSTLATLTCSHSRAPMLFTESIRNAGKEDHCNFSAVTCDSAEHWEMGRCLKCQKASSSPTFGFRLSQSTAPRGQFFFATRNHNDDDTPFCGKQYGIALNPDRWVKGNLWFFVRYKDGSQEIVDLLTGSEELRADNSTVKVVAMARPIDEESTISLLYKRYTSWIWTNGPQQWELRSFSIVESSCTFTHIESTVKIVDQMLTEIKLTR